MKLELLGRDVRRIRKTFGLDVNEFANVLAVHPGTVHRWESFGASSVRVDGVAANVLASLQDRVTQRSITQSDARRVGDDISKALLIGGALLGLFVLVEWLTQSRR